MILTTVQMDLNLQIGIFFILWRNHCTMGNNCVIANGFELVIYIYQNFFSIQWA
jgi:hypothetical protein